jgi:hypothetical protein
MELRAQETRILVSCSLGKMDVLVLLARCSTNAWLDSTKTCTIVGSAADAFLLD